MRTVRLSSIRPVLAERRFPPRRSGTRRGLRLPYQAGTRARANSLHPAHYQRGLAAALIVAVAITAFPSKYLYYVAAPAVAVLSATHVEFIAVRRMIAIFSVFVVYGAVSLIYDRLAGYHVSVPGAFFTMITWFPMLLLFAGPALDRGPLSRRFMRRTALAIALFLVIQAVVGVAQFVVSRNGDAVAGTYGLLDFMNNITINQVFFTFNVFSMVAFLLAYLNVRFSLVAIVAGLLVAALAQSGHQTVFFAVSMAAVWVPRVMQPTRALLALAGAALALSGAAWFYPNTVDVAQTWWQRTVEGRTPKAVAVEEALRVAVDDSKALLFGTGPGQYSSRAALIASGEYLRVKLPDAFTGQSSWFRQSVEPLLWLHREEGEGSAISQPYFAWLTVFTEYGVAGMLLLLGWAVVELVRWRKMVGRSGGNREAAMLLVYMQWFVLFLFMNATIENYFEFAQAITVPILLFNLAKIRIATLARAAHGS